MKNILLFTGLLIVAMGIQSCSDFLDQVPDEQLSNESLYQSKDDVIKGLTQAYSYWDNHLDFTVYPGNEGDDIDFNWNNYSPYYWEMGQFGPSSVQWNRWARFYQAVRASITFQARLDECQDEKLTEQEREWWRGEAEFLEGYYYFLLMQQWGPVPLLKKVYEGSELDGMIASGISRAHADSIAEHIHSKCISAASRLDTLYALPERAGRANVAAAWFLRSRLALYMASPLYNGQSSKTNNGKDYSFIVPTDDDNNKLLNTSFDADRWKEAMDISLQAIKVAERGNYRLLKRETTYGTGGTAQEPSGYSNYKWIFTYARGGEPSCEMVYYKQNLGSWNYGLKHALSLSCSGYSGICPTIGHVEEYFMANGLMPEDDPDYQALAPGYETLSNPGDGIPISQRFQRREPRFYANIVYPERYLYSVRSGGTNADPSSITIRTDAQWNAVSTGTSGANHFQIYANGKDGFNSKSGRDYCNTGFLSAKWVAPTTTTQSSSSDFATPHFRFSELYLNYTEAAIEYYDAIGQRAVDHPEIFEYWDALRDRAGLPGVRASYGQWYTNTYATSIELTNDKLRELIRRERRIELFHEGHRYFDNRRWLDAEREGLPVYGFDVEKNYPDFYTPVEFEKRYWDDKMYWQPIPQSEIDKNRLLTQNPRY
ncbi:MAG: RagB/SusD family nutrient uptake outer membrane protein [Bacteroidales bacterium]|jgi:hypothetical protein|nr:RagB/SusD family nutrient uptake outer membrane protein [Bacteroidales bacterium]